MSEEASPESRFPEEAEVLARTLEEAVVKIRSAAAPAESAAPPKPARRPRRRQQLWEYRVELLHDARRGWYQLWEDREIAALSDLLNERGREGWELVWYGPSPFPAADPVPRFLAVFKRPTEKTEKPSAAPAVRSTRSGPRRR